MSSKALFITKQGNPHMLLAVALTVDVSVG
jgi:hypothetical protein